jgi:peptidoglycan/xylan/chitin deacetylase (PgdA/CDA1 family)
MILSLLKRQRVKTVWFVVGGDLNNREGKDLLCKWNKAGNILANHTYNHLDFNDSLFEI